MRIKPLKVSISEIQRRPSESANQHNIVVLLKIFCLLLNENHIKLIIEVRKCFAQKFFSRGWDRLSESETIQCMVSLLTVSYVFQTISYDDFIELFTSTSQFSGL